MKRIVSGLLAALLIAGSVAVPTYAAAKTPAQIIADAAALEGQFPSSGTYEAECPVCGGGVKKIWKPLTAAVGAKAADGDHYYIPKDFSDQWQAFTLESGKTVCLHTNGKNYTTPNRFAYSGGGSTLNIMGSGSITVTENKEIIRAYKATINLYSTTLVRTDVADVTTAGVNIYSSAAAINMHNVDLQVSTGDAITSVGDLSISGGSVTGGGVNITSGTVKLSGAPQISGTGLLLPENMLLDLSDGLTEGAQIKLTADGVFTSAGMAAYAEYFTPAAELHKITADGDGALRCAPGGAVLVAADGSTTLADDILTQWNTGDFSYIRLYGDETLADLGGAEVWVDINGCQLTVGGTGKLNAFDSANDTYNASACGSIVNNGTVQMATDVEAPNGNRYIALTDGTTSMHRLAIAMRAVTLRTSAAGIYYRAKYECDSVLSAKVKRYGVVVSLEDMPGADFLTEWDENRYTVASEAFVSGAEATSGSVFGIMKPERDAATNAQYGEMDIYANPYVCFDINGMIVVGDNKNPGKTTLDADFNGVGYSLHDVMDMVDGEFFSYDADEQEQLNQFYLQWKESGMDWSFANIGSDNTGTDGVDNSDIDVKFDEGTTNAVCPVCKVKVTWTALSGNAMTVLENGNHYYLANDVTYTGKETAIVRAPGTRDHAACLHLNGHNLTALYTKAIFGSSGILNVMGNGYVTGYATSTNFGTAVQANNTVATSAINLYGGTYRRSDDSSKNAAAITVWTVGGNIYIYEGATVDGKGGTAVYMANASYAQGANAKIGLYGCTINGSVLTAGADLDKGNTTTLEILGATMQTLKAGYNTTITVGGKTVISKLDLAEDTKLTADGLERGSSITVYSDGFITEASANAKDYLDYFKPSGPAYKITVRNDALHCAKDYVSDLAFTQGTTALCPVCEKEVTWTALVAGDTGVALDDGDHYYLADDQTYTGSGNSFVSAPGSGTKTACLHLNGHDLTATATRAIYGSAGTLNVMGSGNVSGVAGSTAGAGSAIQINTGGANGTVNLYSGTYQQAEGAGSDEYTLNIADNGGKINIYADATVKGNISGNAIRMGTSNLVNTAVGVYGGQIDGNIVTGGANQSKGKVNSLLLDNAKVSGTVDVVGVNALKVRHATVIQLLRLDQKNTLLTMDRLTDGASITVDTNGKFTVAHRDAGTYKNYFSPKNKAATISMANNELYYTVDYVSDLTVTDGQGYCPVCEKTVTWEALESVAGRASLGAGKHVYLTGDLTYEGTETSFIAGPTSGNTACLHLNGHDITATKTFAIYSSGGVLNVMGSGIVTGYTGNATYGGAVTANTVTQTTAINLYGGTFKKTADSAANARVVAFRSNGGKINIYAGATVDAGGGNAIYVSTSNLRDSVLGIYGATVKGGIYSAGANPDKGFSTVIRLEDATVTSTIWLDGVNDVAFEGKTVVGKLVIPQGQLVSFTDLKAGSSIKVSADGAFTAAFDQAEDFLQYFSAADEGDWVIVRDHALYQGVKQEITAATEDDKTALDTAYAGKEALHGEMHDHTNTGPKADGKNSLAEWLAEMERLDMDFATIVDHKQSIHMYHENWDDTIFIGGSEPQAIITDSKASQKVIHYNMIFDNPADLEAIVQEFPEFGYVAASDGVGGTFGYPNFTTARFAELAQAIYEKGGLLVHVHPKYDKYMISDDPLDYWFSDYTGFEITTGDGGNMMAKNNEEAYQCWVDLLELGKKIWATAGSDEHALPNASALTTLYCAERSASAYLECMRSGNFAPGWVGIRMTMGDAVMGGETGFAGKRLQFSIGDIYNSDEQDAYGTAPAYVEGHTYRVELYDDSGILMESVIDPTQMTYFAIDADENSKFYRVVVWDDTAGTRIAVGNPIWNVGE